MPMVLQGTAGPVELLTYAEAGDRLGLEQQTVWAYVTRGRFHPIRLARTDAYPAGTPFLLADEVAWYERRRRLPARHMTQAGPSPYVARYAELLDAGAAVAPLLADPGSSVDLLARIKAGASDATPALPAQATPAPTPPSAQGVSASNAALDAAGAELGRGAIFLLILSLLAAVLVALLRNTRPDAGKIAQLRAIPGASEAVQRLAEWLNTAA